MSITTKTPTLLFDVEYPNLSFYVSSSNPVSSSCVSSTNSFNIIAIDKDIGNIITEFSVTHNKLTLHHLEKPDTYNTLSLQQANTLINTIKHTLKNNSIIFFFFNITPCTIHIIHKQLKNTK